MRDIALIVFILGTLPLAVKRPVIGVLLYVWLSVMNPHRLTWGMAYNMPFAFLVAMATLLGILMTKEPKRMPVTPVTVLLLVFIGWMNITTLFAFEPVGAGMMWDKVMKIQVMVLAAVYLFHTRQHVQWLMWVVAASVAFFGVKGGLHTLTTGGMYKVWGPSGSFIAENNQLAVAVIMTIPLLRYLHLTTKNRWIRLGLLGSMAACGFSALGSHSRGALLGIGAMLGLFWMKSRGKIITGALLLMMVPVAIQFMPENWTERMRTIDDYQEDASAQGRINSWTMAFNVANARPLIGGGFELYSLKTFAQYAPNPLDLHSAHSIYFQVLGEHGWFGFALFMALWFMVWREASWIARRVRGHADWQWASDLARMIQVSLVGYAAGGAFVNLAYYDVPYYLLAAIVVTRGVIEREFKAPLIVPWRSSPPVVTPAPQPNLRAPGRSPANGTALRQGPVSKWSSR